MSVSRRLLLALTAILSMLGVSLVVTPPAANAAVDLQYSASAGGTFVRAVGGAVRSDLTAASTVAGTTYPNTQANAVADLDVLNGLANVGAVETSMSATNPGGVGTITGSATTTGVSLLGGAITADAVETEITAHHDGADDYDGEVRTTFVGLEIAGEEIPITVPRNFGITVPGVASVVLNRSRTTTESGELTVSGAALTVTLLGAYGETPVGTTIQVNPVNAGFRPDVPSDATPVSGHAFGTFVYAGAPPLVRAISGRTAAVTMPGRGTGGYPVTNSTAALDLPGLAGVGAVESSCRSTSVPVTLDATCSNKATRVKLLNGAVLADVVTAEAHLTKDAGGVVTKEASSTIANLRVLGLPIRVQPGATTQLTIPGVLTITLNAQEETANGITVTALRVRLGLPAFGLPAGAIIEVANANVGAP